MADTAASSRAEAEIDLRSILVERQRGRWSRGELLLEKTLAACPASYIRVRRTFRPAQRLERADLPASLSQNTAWQLKLADTIPADVSVDMRSSDPVYFGTLQI